MLEWHIVFGFSMKCTSRLFIRAIRIDFDFIDKSSGRIRQRAFLVTN